MSDTVNNSFFSDINLIIRNVSILHLSFDRILAVKFLHVGKGDITTDYSLAFGALNRHGSLPISKLAEAVERSIPYTTQMVREMQESGYFAREKSADDQRINAVTLTPYGVEVFHEINKLAAEAIAEKFSGLPQSEIQLLSIILARAANPFLLEAGQ